MGNHSLLQGTFSTQGLNLGLLHCRQILYHLSNQGTPYFTTKPLRKPKIASLMAQRINHLPAMQETQVQSLGWEDPLEKEMAAHSSVLA